MAWKSIAGTLDLVLIQPIRRLSKKFQFNFRGSKIVPKHLMPNGRGVDQSFKNSCKLYRGFEPSDLDPITGLIRLETIRFPDLSCNWDRYSVPEDVRYRIEGAEGDGCYSVTTKDVRFDHIATPVHDPITDGPRYNYAHVEVRCLKNGEPFSFVPPRNRKLPGSRTRKLAYRTNLANKAQIELQPLVLS